MTQCLSGECKVVERFPGYKASTAVVHATALPAGLATVRVSSASSGNSGRSRGAVSSVQLSNRERQQLTSADRTCQLTPAVLNNSIYTKGLGLLRSSFQRLVTNTFLVLSCYLVRLSCFSKSRYSSTRTSSTAGLKMCEKC